MKKVIWAAVCAAAVFGGQSAIAATCTAAEASKVTPLDTSIGNGCEVFSGNDSASAVNTDAVFGFSDWVYLAKDNTDTGGIGTPDEGDATAFSLSGDKQSGTWNIHATGYADYLFVVKASTTYLTYRVSDVTGTYATAVTNKKGNFQDISHITLYARGTATPIPVPAALPLVVSGIGILGLLRARRRRREPAAGSDCTNHASMDLPGLQEPGLFCSWLPGARIWKQCAGRRGRMKRPFVGFVSFLQRFIAEIFTNSG